MDYKQNYSPSCSAVKRGILGEVWLSLLLLLLRWPVNLSDASVASFLIRTHAGDGVLVCVCESVHIVSHVGRRLGRQSVLSRWCPNLSCECIFCKQTVRVSLWVKSVRRLKWDQRIRMWVYAGHRRTEPHGSIPTPCIPWSRSTSNYCTQTHTHTIRRTCTHTRTPEDRGCTPAAKFTPSITEWSTLSCIPTICCCVATNFHLYLSGHKHSLIFKHQKLAKDLIYIISLTKIQMNNSIWISIYILNV